jgi:hypothetical protein
MRKHSVTLALHTATANTINANKTSMTWNNLNLQNIMGSIYDDYDVFDIKLNSTVCLSGSATDANNNLIVYLQGLPFIGYGYAGKMPIGLNKTGNNTTGSVTQMSYDTTNSFNKPNSILNLTITLDAVSTNALSASPFGHQAYLFTISGIK